MKKQEVIALKKTCRMFCTRIFVDHLEENNILMKPFDSLYLAPMLGITDSAYRAAFTRQFGGFDVAITPFIKTIQGGRFKESKMSDFVSSRNGLLPIIPQILSNNAEDFIAVANVLFDLGYGKINLNLGCPVPMTAGRGRGAGLLPHPAYVDRLLDEIFKSIPNRLSVKTRLGLDNPDQLGPMIKVFNRYPLFEVAVHPRTAKQGYGGAVNHQAFLEVLGNISAPVIYSGDITSVASFIAIRNKYPSIKRWMIGRGVLADPFLPQKLRDLQNVSEQNSPMSPSSWEPLLDFYEEFRRQMQLRGFAENLILVRLKTQFYYHADFLGADKRSIRKVRKARGFAEFIGAVNELSS